MCKDLGDQFRRTFAQIGDLRSLLPNEVKTLALTATATMDTYSVVKTRLGIVEAILISMPPERQNIFYRVCPKIELQPFVKSIAEEFLMEDFEKTFSVCKNITMTVQIFTYCSSRS